MGCSGSCGGCDDGSSSGSTVCDDKKGCCSGGGSGCDSSSSCDACRVKLSKAKEKAKDDNGMMCNLCGYFTQYAEPNRCDGGFYCFKCRGTKAWQIPPGRWLS